MPLLAIFAAVYPVGIRYFHNDSCPLPRDYHELTCNLLIQLYSVYYLSAHGENIDQQSVVSCISKAKIMLKSQCMHMDSNIPSKPAYGV